MRGFVLLLSLGRVCSIKTENNILFVIVPPEGIELHLSDEVEIERPVLSGVLSITNMTRGGQFQASIRPGNVHDLRLPMGPSGTSRTPSEARLTGD
jgi:hypothetical protein